MPVALAEMEQKSNIRHCGRSLRPVTMTGLRTLPTLDFLTSLTQNSFAAAAHILLQCSTYD